MQREGKDVGRASFPHVVEVQVGHLSVAAEGHLDLDRIGPQRDARRL